MGKKLALRPLTPDILEYLPPGLFTILYLDRHLLIKKYAKIFLRSDWLDRDHHGCEREFYEMKVKETYWKKEDFLMNSQGNFFDEI